MPAPYSNDLRQKLITCYEQGELSQEAVAKRFLVSVRTFKRWWKRYQERERIAPEPMGGWVEPKVDEAGGAQIRAWLKARPELTLVQLCERYERHFGVSMSRSAMDRALKRLNLTRKKRRSMSPRARASRSNDSGPPIKNASARMPPKS
ncbi:helix-turn-helix domain-containing protein [Nitrosococcus wardiae]|uniref:Transposase n=1 Tax=Nitrosococcus wardiae TaxID=1814290 RepID=A0A4P7C3P2_9GAMM|nr:helix-turn-helix domain-containing protein [Nitrosococcus wardiae]QBQ54319.1 transposase [Nitrosococcus wardiae]QBQ54458.1 transposase [Nitrosococcus wardiae]QBQ54469.1 transposase [Nitrosococcus wardiae]QBQ56198.1 transposase [Nitrosococcus wardiae]QBQ56297.1 transposase [Nitrosococcus wardiae]